MDTSQEHNPKQARQAEDTIEEIEDWDADTLPGWIEKHRQKVLKNADHREKFKAEDISGDVFLDHAGDAEWFENKCKLPSGTCTRLAKLAKEMAQKGKEQDTGTGKSTDHAPLLFSSH